MDYVDPMKLMRRTFKVMVLALIFAIGGNGVAMALEGVDAQENCVHAIETDLREATAGIAHTHEMDGSHHTFSQHDHDTCMLHACPAMFSEHENTVNLAGTLLATMTMQDHTLHVVARAESLHRPPNT